MSWCVGVWVWACFTAEAQGFAETELLFACLPKLNTQIFSAPLHLHTLISLFPYLLIPLLKSFHNNHPRIR